MSVKPSVLYYVSGAAHRAHYFYVENIVYLASEISDIYVDDVGVSVKIESPHRVKRLFAGDDHILVLKKIYEQIVFLFGQFHGHFVVSYAARVPVYDELAVSQSVRLELFALLEMYAYAPRSSSIANGLVI